MGVYTNRESLSNALLPFRKGKKIGFIPTMGALHNGHLSLVKQALNENDCVVVSIFVNPTQFDNKKDLEKYPRNLDADVKFLSQLEGTLFVFAPEASNLYNGPVISKKYTFGNIEHEMEGKHRKGHFDGVGTVVNLLFRAVMPDQAYFGEKDFQQLQIIRKLVAIEKLPIRIVNCPIVREPNGLAMSSRNKRLTEQQFNDAVLINKTLSEVKEKFSALSIPALNKLVVERFLKNTSLKIEYFEIANERTLKTAKRKYKNSSYRAFIAVYAGEIRLIDNMALS
ncbi:pantoate--beta-alanine ligase [Ulvibacter litoralis]|uniref:Pantothenate synthetase n=1 Tax=Ulvibacter litoralis TaxID=227084 RepID=A0A1G7CW14_9FLAO|nr:pantoate--beta-alanine ligase [Ulvibacter litoralis]GHC45851.1 pantothenate synthetase [Ulvibacter litoralis]SDE43433.1 pantoate--beta-alanine ligase [Ulvibacter litoralis]